LFTFSFSYPPQSPRTKIPATVSCGILQERCGKVTVSRRKAPEVEAVFRPELFSDEFLRVPCTFLWETVGNHRKKFRKSFGRNTASIFQCVSGVFQWNVLEMRRVSPVPAVRLRPGQQIFKKEEKLNESSSFIFHIVYIHRITIAFKRNIKNSIDDSSKNKHIIFIFFKLSKRNYLILNIFVKEKFIHT
jgi:hypothetical protein